jgi:hypothetical protein
MRLSIAGGLVALICLCFFRPRTGDRPVIPAVDLRRVIVPTAGVTVTEHGAQRLSVATDDWVLSVVPLDYPRAINALNVSRQGASRARGCRSDVIHAPGAPDLDRFLIDFESPLRAARADYVVSFGGAWAFATGHGRSPGERFDVAPVDRFLLALRLADGPRLDSEVLPAWRAYQRGRTPGSPVGKFVLYMDPAPVRIGDYQAGLRDRTLFTDSDFRRGGRRVTPDLIEFYVEDDPTAIRVDLWLDRPPHDEGRKAVFETSLHVEQPTVSIWSFEEVCPCGRRANSEWGVTSYGTGNRREPPCCRAK